MRKISWLAAESPTSLDGLYSKELKNKTCCNHIRRQSCILLFKKTVWSSSLTTSFQYLSNFLQFICQYPQKIHLCGRCFSFISLFCDQTVATVEECPQLYTTFISYPISPCFWVRHSICALMNSLHDVHSNTASYPLAWHITFIMLVEINTVITLIKFRM